MWSSTNCTPIAADCAVLWPRTAIHLQLGDDSESRRASDTIAGGRSRDTERQRRTRGRKDICFLQSARRQPCFGHSPELHQRIVASGAGISKTRSADNGFFQLAPADGSFAHVSSASQSSATRKI